MDPYIIKVSKLRITNSPDSYTLSRAERELAYEKYKDGKSKKYWARAKYDGNGYEIYNNFELLWYCQHAKEEENQYINIAINQEDIDNIALKLKYGLEKQKLNPILEALYYQEYMQLKHITQRNLAEGLHKTQGAISNKLRLLNLPPQIQLAIYRGNIKERHGRAILKLEKQNDFFNKAMAVFAKIIDQELSVAETEDIVDHLLGKQVGVRDSLNIKKVNNTKEFKKPETSIIVNDIKKQLDETIDVIHQLFPRLEITLEHGIDRKDYVFLLKLKGLNDDNGKNNSNN